MSTTLVETQRIPELEENRVVRRARINRPRWSPKEWHPVYEEVVLLDALGYKNTAIAEMKGFTKEHVSNILCTKQAKIIKTIILKQMEKKRELTIEQRLDKIAQRAMDRVEETINNDELAAKNPLGVFDRAITVLKSTNNIKEEKQQVTQNTMIVSDEMVTKLMQAVKTSDEAKRLHSGLEGKVGIDLVDASTPS